MRLTIGGCDLAKQPHDSKELKGERLREALELTGLPLLTFVKKYGLSYSTIRHWVSGRQGLTEQGALNILQVLRNEYIDCSLDWLLYGKGTPPHRIDMNIEVKTRENPENANLTIQDEINDFKKRHLEAAIYEITDDSMQPFYKPGDIVAGIWHYGTDIAKLIGKHCIAEVKDHGTVCRNLAPSSIPLHYNLYALNPNTRLVRPHLYDQLVVACAPVIWIRRGKKW